MSMGRRRPIDFRKDSLRSCGIRIRGGSVVASVCVALGSFSSLSTLRSVCSCRGGGSISGVSSICSSSSVCSSSCVSSSSGLATGSGGLGCPVGDMSDLLIHIMGGE